MRGTPAARPRRALLWWMASSVPLALLLVSCFEPAVEERLLLSFPADGQLHLHLTVELRREGLGGREGTERRLRELEEQLLGGFDPWSARFATLAPATETYFWRKEAGQLARFEREVLLPDPTALADFFADTAVVASYRVEDGVAELGLYPALANRASRKERRQVDDALDTWSAVLARYFTAATELYDYLDGRPDRAPALFAAVFDENHGEERFELQDGEEELANPVIEAMSEAVDVLVVDPDAGFSLEELSRKVFDPFPAAPLEIETAGEVVETEGLIEVGDRWRVPALSLWTALDALSGKWLDPDPLLALVARERHEVKTDLDVDAFAALPRSAAPAPTPYDVRTALEQELTPRDAYRLAWRSTAPAQ